MERLERGIAKREGERPGLRQRHSTGWLDRVLALYDDRILPFDLEVRAEVGRSQCALSATEVLTSQIAATALEHGLTVATRNVAHFAPTGVAVFDPFTGKAYPPS